MNFEDMIEVICLFCHLGDTTLMGREFPELKSWMSAQLYRQYLLELGEDELLRQVKECYSTIRKEKEARMA